MPPGTARSAFYIDLDGFKTVNDRYGHRFGDLVLIEVARRLRAVSPADGLVARFGGDEFVVVVAGPSGDDLSALAASLHEAITSPVTETGIGPVHIGASVGSASSGDADIDLDDLLDRADRAQYRAKQDGHRRRAG